MFFIATVPSYTRELKNIPKEEKNKMKVEKIKTEPEELDIAGATLLSIEEYTRYKNIIPICHTEWWLRSPSVFGAADLAMSVHSNGDTDRYGDDVGITLGVRPALIINNLKSSNFQIGDKFVFGKQTLTVISKGYALCDNIIGDCKFRRATNVSDENNYNASDVKKFVDEWYQQNTVGNAAN